MLAAEAAKAQGGRLPLDVLLAPAIKHAREGYTVTRSQARLTRREAAGDGQGRRLPRGLPGRRQAAGGGRHAQAKRACRHARASRRCRARRFLPRRCRARDRRRSRAHRQPGDARRPGKIPRPWSPSRSACAYSAGTLYNTPPPTQGLGLADHPRRCSSGCASQQGRKLRARPRHSSRRPSAPSACATASSPIRT